MSRDSLGSARDRTRLRALEHTPLNFDRADVPRVAGNGWTVDDLRQALPGETPGRPERDGSWAIARRLITGYEFADPSIVRATYDPDAPLEGRTMSLRLRALGIVQVHVGVRILDVIDERTERDGRPAQVWGWRYGTLKGHVERGEMSWEVWKWLDTGDVDFRIHAVSRPAQIVNPVVALGFRLVGPHERIVFLRSTRERMCRLTEEALHTRDAGAVAAIANQLTARPTRDRAAPEGLLPGDERTGAA